MSVESYPRRLTVKVALFGLLAFGLLTIRFAPNWITFVRGLRGAETHVSSAADRAAVDRAILGSYSARGYYVLKQAGDLGVEIDDPKHKIVRWRLLVPAMGYFLGLPRWLILGLAQIGCLGLVLALVAIGLRDGAYAEGRGYEAAGLGVVAGASAPFFTSMGLLGYYDSWLALGLIGVALARPRWVVWLACLLVPWIDERFVIGLPLALWVRRIMSEREPARLWAWCRQQAIVPLILAAGYAAVRLMLGGTGSSQTVGQYMDQFVFGEKLSLARRLFGAWAGLRLGWVLVAAAVAGVWRCPAAGGGRAALVLAAGVVLTAFVGLCTALDLGRSMVLILPVVPLGWILAARLPVWSKGQVALILTAAALILPARHVVGWFSRPVDDFWSPPRALLTAENGLGVMYGNGDGVRQDPAEAVKWYRKAAELGSPEAQHNLGVMYGKGEGVPQSLPEAVRWIRRAAEQGLPTAEYNLGMIYAKGEGVPADAGEAVKWLRRAALQDDPQAAGNLGLIYADGAGVAKDGREAAKWYAEAVALGNADAANNLGVMYASGNGLPTDLVQACRWLTIGSQIGSDLARKNLALVVAGMTPAQIAEARKLALGLSESPR